jgi:formylglycine-generating enzyme required for sulfatase activity
MPQVCAVMDKLPQNIHGWSAEKVQSLQRSVAKSLRREPVFRDRLKDGSEGPEMVVIPPGSYLMGSPDSDNKAEPYEKPQHRVTIGRPFAIGRYPVTFDEYDRYCLATARNMPKDRGWGRGRRPVINVTWRDAVAYCAWLAEQTGRRYRLPTEAEWEYAARAGTTTPYWWGTEVGQGNANCDGGGTQWDNKQTTPVGSFQPNTFGLYDTTGNVWEWVQDVWHDDYYGAPDDGNEWIAEHEDICETACRVCRGSSWGYDPKDARVSSRDWNDPDFSFRNNGVQLARDL